MAHAGLVNDMHSGEECNDCHELREPTTGPPRKEATLEFDGSSIQIYHVYSTNNFANTASSKATQAAGKIIAKPTYNQAKEEQHEAYSPCLDGSMKLRNTGASPLSFAELVESKSHQVKTLELEIDTLKVS
jgi:hypothetical protein